MYGGEDIGMNGLNFINIFYQTFRFHINLLSMEILQLPIDGIWVF